jgi:hypothetical protein
MEIIQETVLGRQKRLPRATDLSLAFGAIVGSATSNQYALDGCAATPTRLAGALVHAMLQLEEAAHAVGIDIIGHGRPAETNGMAEHLTQREPKPAVFGDRNAMCAPARPDARAKKALVGINVAHPGEQRLVEERGLDGHAAAVEESGELWCGDIKRVGAWWCETLAGGNAAEFQAAETTRIDEAQLAAAGEVEARMRVRGERAVRSGDQ